MLGFRTNEDAFTYDVVIGNPPWGDKTVTNDAKFWASNNGWTVANNDFGILFVAKSTYLTKPGGQICMVQSAGALLYNKAPTAAKLRRKIFLDFVKIESICNLASFRIFRDVKVPTCILHVQNVAPDGEAFWYECPKPLRTIEDANRIIIEPHDIHAVYPEDVEAEPEIWSTLMWGGNRDRALIRKLKQYQTLETLKRNKVVKTREGINRGNRKKRQESILGKPYLRGSQFPELFNLQLPAVDLEKVTDPYIDADASTNFEAFELPQLLIKTSWVRDVFRFQARLVDSSQEIGGVICEQSFISVHAKHAALLETCCACYNSNFANYYLLLTSGRFAFDRSEPLVEELTRLPIPEVADSTLFSLATLTDVDAYVHNLFDLQEAESILVEDLGQYTLPDFKRAPDAVARRPTHRHSDSGTEVEFELQRYCDVFRKVLKAAYGEDKLVGAAIFSEQTGDKLPVRMVSIYLNSPDVASVHVEPMGSSELRRQLTQIYKMMRGRDDEGLLYQRCVRTYQTRPSSGITTVVINIVKPDQIRYWTRSIALRDADEVAADLMTWANASRQANQRSSEVVGG